MRAKFSGTCGPCGVAIEPGQAISIFMSSWAHDECKRLVIRQRQEEAGPPVELEPALPPERTAEYIGQRTEKRRSLRAFKRTQRA